MKRINNGEATGSASARTASTGATIQRLRLAGFGAASALIVTACGSDSPAETAVSSPVTTISAPGSSAGPSTTIERQPVGAPTSEEQPSDTITLDATAPDTIALDAAVETTILESTTDATTETTLAVLPTDECRRLTDFDDGDGDGDGWVIVNDGVMGGRSNGAVEFSDSAMRFTGNVVTAGGGFTSVRFQLVGDELDDSEYLALRVRTDERNYGLTLEDAAQTRGRFVSHGADFIIDGPADADRWQTTELRYDELLPSVIGQQVDAPPFEPDEATEIGIIIADGTDGPFALDIDWIDACSTV